jgi:hypothetical protein
MTDDLVQNVEESNAKEVDHFSIVQEEPDIGIQKNTNEASLQDNETKESNIEDNTDSQVIQSLGNPITKDSVDEQSDLDYDIEPMDILHNDRSDSRGNDEDSVDTLMSFSILKDQNKIHRLEGDEKSSFKSNAEFYHVVDPYAEMLDAQKTNEETNVNIASKIPSFIVTKSVSETNSALESWTSLRMIALAVLILFMVCGGILCNMNRNAKTKITYSGPPSLSERFLPYGRASRRNSPNLLPMATLDPRSISIDIGMESPVSPDQFILSSPSSAGMHVD